MNDVSPATAARIEVARQILNRTPWWKPLKRQEAARRYRIALLVGAYEQMGLK